MRSFFVFAALSTLSAMAQSVVPNCAPNLGSWSHQRACTETDPCTNLLATYGNTPNLTAPEATVETCRAWYEGQWWDDGAPKSIAVPGVPTDPGTPTTRHYCSYVPPNTTVPEKVPLLIFLHGSGGSPLVPYQKGWRKSAETGDPHFNGGKAYAILSPMAIQRHWPPSGAIGDGEDGSKYDFLFRNMSINDDVRYLDTLIDHFVASGRIDPQRIYMSGWSNGAYFSSFYAAARSGNTNGGAWPVFAGETPGKNRIAATTPFSGAGPWLRSTCTYSPTPSGSTLPVMIVLYACDIVSCQAAIDYTAQLSAGGSQNATVLLLADNGTQTDVAACNNNNAEGCNMVKRLANHAKFPTARIPDMLTFLQRYTAAVGGGAATTTVAATTTAAPGGTASPTTTTTASPPNSGTNASSSTTTTPSPSEASSNNSTSSAATTEAPPATSTASPSGASSGGQPSVSPPPSPTTTTVRDRIAAQIRIAGTRFQEALENITKRVHLEFAVKADLQRMLRASVTGDPTSTHDFVTIDALSVGSLVVDFTVNASQPGASSAASDGLISAEAVSTALNSEVGNSGGFVATSAVYNEGQSNPETLSLEAASVPAATTTTTAAPPNSPGVNNNQPPAGPSSPSSSDGSCKGPCIAFIIVALISFGCVVVAVVFVIISSARKKGEEESNDSGGARHPEDDSAAPPPTSQAV